MDYLLFDPRTNNVWVPAGNTAAVDVIDVVTGKLRRIDGFATREVEREGRKRVVGPSSAALGTRGTVYIGNRGDSSVCAFDEDQLTKQMCGALDAMPDAIAYVENTQELWVTTPEDSSIRILDAATLVQKARLALDGPPEGGVPDATRGRFYTNLEDKDVTLAIDLSSHETVATWKPSCGEEGPHGLRLDESSGVLIVACSARVETLDVAHEGAILATLATGNGVDDIDYSSKAHEVYVAAAMSGNLTIARLQDHGSLTLVASITTRRGARNGVVADNGTVYLAHSQGSELVMVSRGR
jgi:DNA-binding beta-propeller fold protein YncE